MRWTSGTLATLRSSEPELRRRCGQRVEVVGVTTAGTTLGVARLADVVALHDGALFTLPMEQVADLRSEET